MPDNAGNVDELRSLLNIGEDDWPLVLAYLVAALIPDLPHPVLLLRGEHGTAKSMAAWLLSSLIDPCAAQLRTAPGNVEDWAVAAAGSWVTVLDNISHLQPWLQDAICKAVTGDGLLRRMLYTNQDVTVLAFRRVLAITSIDPGPLHGDLADRLLSIDLDRIDEPARADETSLKEKWTSIRPRVLAGLLNLTVEVLRVLTAIRHQDLPRMADFARVLLAVDEVCGSDGYRQYREQARGVAEMVFSSDPLGVAIREHLTQSWQGTATELLRTLTPDGKAPNGWPTTPQAIGGRLARLAPSARTIGWTIDQAPRSGKDRTRGWIIEPPSAANHTQQIAADMTATSTTPASGHEDMADKHTPYPLTNPPAETQ
jgi:hypothetical protein